MQKEAKGAPIDAAAAHLDPAGGAKAPRRKREAAALWRAVAGMAISLALACLIVMLKFTGEANHRAARIRRHADALLSRIARLESQVASERARIAAANRELAAAQSLRGLLRAPDAVMLQLSPPTVPAATAADKTPPPAERERAEATLALAPSERRAVLMVSRLKAPAADTIFVLWWGASRGAPVRAAAEFTTAADGSAVLSAALPARFAVASAMITAERAAKGGAPGALGAPAAADGDGAKAAGVSEAEHTAPSGPVLLRGALAR